MDFSSYDAAALLYQAKTYSRIGIDTPTPILRIWQLTFVGTCANVVGTTLLFETTSKQPDSNGTPNTNNNATSTSTTTSSDNNNNNDHASGGPSASSRVAQDSNGHLPSSGSVRPQADITYRGRTVKKIRWTRVTLEPKRTPSS
eukprot:TRINITY_DN16278_c0_g1_i1.p1 TRINITY_DN16278_c0_g1~~TRINITY_DN16278_c0_g1_i1.p1  ORF type:complete len:144 (-),score=45.84 TRINITY_DN16278_c0_g1_i1:186-617(-)